jgi:hypothetical protein
MLLSQQVIIAWVSLPEKEKRHSLLFLSVEQHQRSTRSLKFVYTACGIGKGVSVGGATNYTQRSRDPGVAVSEASENTIQYRTSMPMVKGISLSAFVL